MPSSDFRQAAITAIVAALAASASPALATNLSTGAATWSVTAPNSTTVQTAVNAANPAWTTMLQPAHWVSPPGSPQTAGVFVYKLNFSVGKKCKERRLTGRFLGDNTVVLFLDNNQIAASQGTPNYGFLPGSVTSFSAPVPPGPHTLRAEVNNAGGPSGLVIQGQDNCNP